MLPDKVKLLPESKKLFLEFGLKRVIEKQGLASKEQAKSWMYMFVKMLCISKSYLYLSRRTSPNFYRLNLYFGHDPDDIIVFFASDDWYFIDENRVSFTYTSVQKLIKLLLPSYVGANFHSNTTNASFERYLELLKLTEDTNGKIGLKLNDYELETQFVQASLENFATRTYALECSMDQFKAVERLLSKFPCFDFLTVDFIATSGQILRVLKCKAKELKLIFNNGNFVNNNSHLVNLKNESVKKLYLSFDDFRCFEVEELAKQLHKCFLSLKHFHFCAYFNHYRGIPNNQVFDHVVSCIRRMEYLKACFGNGLESMFIDFYVVIYNDDERDNTWIKKICENSEFKHWKIESREKIVNTYNGDTFDEDYLDEEDPLELAYSDTLNLKLDDAKYKLEMTVEVLIPKDQTLVNAGE